MAQASMEPRRGTNRKEGMAKRQEVQAKLTVELELAKRKNKVTTCLKFSPELQTWLKELQRQPEG